MRLFARLLASILLLFVPIPAPAQAATHQAVLTWTASTDAAANPTLTYNIYRFSGACPATAPTTVGTGGFTKINASAITALTFTDTGIGVGSVCYYGTSLFNGAESVPGVPAGGTVGPATINLKITLQ